jgi:hypothetical protein
MSPTSFTESCTEVSGSRLVRDRLARELCFNLTLGAQRASITSGAFRHATGTDERTG